MENARLSKSDLIDQEAGKDEASNSLLSDAVNFVKAHPVETAVAATALASGLYNAGKLANGLSHQAESKFGKIFSPIAAHPEGELNASYDAATGVLSYRSAHAKILAIESAPASGVNVAANGDFGAHLHPDLNALLASYRPLVGESGGKFTQDRLSKQLLGEAAAPGVYGDLGAHMHPDSTARSLLDIAKKVPEPLSVAESGSAHLEMSTLGSTRASLSMPSVGVYDGTFQLEFTEKDLAELRAAFAGKLGTKS
jgi:hypothetical protein